MEPAIFRPPLRGLGRFVLLGAAAGIVVGLVLDVPPLLASLFGGIAAAVAVAARHARGLRVVAGADGVRVIGAPPVDAGWPALRLGFGLAQRADGAAQRYAIFADERGRSFAFAETGGSACGAVRGADGRAVEVVELRDAALLLGVIVQRAPAWHVIPESLQQSGPAAFRADDMRDPGTPSIEAPGNRRPARRARPGVWAMLAKVGTKLAAGVGKLGAGAVKAVKTANVGWALASAATYSLLFSWKFALAIMVQLFVHEYGHVHAMRRTGMKVRGMYFVPFLGALAVTEDAFRSRRQQVYVALNGPIWGSLLALGPAALWFVTNDPAWATIAAWWALINLFNLLPIAPLDGGRVMQALSYSYSSSLGVILSVVGLAIAVALGTAFGFSLIWLIALVGAMELASDAQLHAGARALRLLPEPLRFGVPQWLYLRAAVGSGPAPARDGLFLRTLERQERAARAAPMTRRQLLAGGLAYAGLAMALVIVVWAMRKVPGADVASKILE